MTKKIVSLVSLVASAGALVLTAVPAHARSTPRAGFENLDSTTLGVSAFILVAFAASVVLARLAYARK